jgi:hypothetical protein
MDLDEKIIIYREPVIDATLPRFGSFGQAISEKKMFRN